MADLYSMPIDMYSAFTYHICAPCKEAEFVNTLEMKVCYSVISGSSSFIVIDQCILGTRQV